MHPALYSWRDELPGTFVRLLAYVGGAGALSMLAALVFAPPRAVPIKPAPSEWIEIEKPFPAFALSIPEAADVASQYVIRRNVRGSGRKDIVSLGDPDSAAPYLEVEIYRPGSEIGVFPAPQAVIVADATRLGPEEIRGEAPLASKFGPLAVVAFKTSQGTPRSCLGFVRAFDDPRLQISGWFCQGGDEFIERSTLACALDRLTLLAAGSEPKVGALFAKAELKRSYCGQHDPILAATPKYQVLWKALATRPEPRRIGR